MLKRIFLMLCFFLSFQLFPQKTEMKQDILYDEFTHNLLKTFDVLYIADNPDKYLVNKSPLSHFNGYRRIYSDTVIIHGNSFDLPFDAEGNSEKNMRSPE